ncbi:hypothetical protein ABRY23_12430 [Melioribacteraceae bacterium 4301-Me]|uniref:hypothetical protein n=1 Tax=Pyranulibacter aquaticus TaxID=3163344 RepID=UPI0035958C40
MNKIVLNIGLLVFFIGIIFFAYRGLPVEVIIFRSLLLFLFTTIIAGVFSIILIKSFSKNFYKKDSN